MVSGAFIEPPQRLAWWLRPWVWLAERIGGRPLLPARLLAWYPRAALGSGVLEALVASGHVPPGRDELSPRLLKLVRLQVSRTIGCPFCLDMNGAEAAAADITAGELWALQQGVAVDAIASLDAAERAALAYATAASRTPLHFDEALVAAVRHHFSPRQMVILATTAAQVNYWGRLVQALGVPPAGFCALPPQPPPAAPEGRT